ncbi:hypothetical protein K493DRAFT_314529 [Basidiobolus meristosporus CBS 931.73]|uniref:Uncharacterized protein n=1 Tax=Basidiobolus meristosporus CBS 931.73 TaxID=1314790 RepID=A0A1Y1YEP3_9FUNG|nr:hypothetical protein K493DRAFT_314529 [Basidiobolus meristosporus CBS 931.73]|eukprot:ORX96415.1 hypothetical protein K493DRAFT_314529 [Basidiobolus meristosporus CBS 931.73]
MNLLRSQSLLSVLKCRVLPLPTSHSAVRSVRLYSNQPSSAPNKGRGWRKYAYRFRSQPVSHLVSFGILHEITAILPIVVVYYFIDATGLEIPVPEVALEQSNRFFSKLRSYVGLDPLASDSRVALNLAASYGITKSIMPLRIAACFALTPWFARRVIQPCTNVAKWIKKN